MSDDDWTLTDERLTKLAEESKATPCPQTAYCPDEISSFRFELHVVADKLISELQSLRTSSRSVQALADDIRAFKERHGAYPAWQVETLLAMLPTRRKT